LAVSMQTIKR